MKGEISGLEKAKLGAAQLPKEEAWPEPSGYLRGSQMRTVRW